jgi:hypothetical protein
MITQQNQRYISYISLVDNTYLTILFQPEYEDKLDPYVKVCFWCFFADWKLVRFQYFQYRKKKIEATVFDLPHLNYTGDKKGKKLKHENGEAINAFPITTRYLSFELLNYYYYYQNYYLIVYQQQS